MKYWYFLVALVCTSFLNAQGADFKVMTYNLMYYKDASAPCTPGISNSAKDQAFKTVFKAVQPDILCVNELVGFSDNSGARSVLNNVINTDGEVNFTSAAYSNNSFSSITNMLFYDSSKFVLQSQSHISSSVNNITLPRVIDFYRLYYRDPLLGNGHDTVFFTIISGHLKAGNSSSDANDRKLAAEAIMDYLENSVTDENVILTGDMNVYGSTEAAYQAFTNYPVASERFVDPLPAGSWNNNANYAVIHTQSTHAFGSGCYSGGGLDDRFDFILYSRAIANNSQFLQYKFNSTKAIGNDGNHFNQSVNSGSNSSVSQTVADALYDFSDHLPVVAEFEIDLVSLTTQSHHVFENQFRFKNPVSDELMITRGSSKHDLRVVLFDPNGRLLKELDWSVKDLKLRLNTSSLRNGMYIVKILDPNGHVATQKIIKVQDEI